MASEVAQKLVEPTQLRMACDVVIGHVADTGDRSLLRFEFQASSTRLVWRLVSATLHSWSIEKSQNREAGTGGSTPLTLPCE